MITNPSIVWLDPNASIQAAVDALGSVGGTVHLRAGTFSMASTLTLPDGVPIHLIGSGRGVTVLDWTAMGGTPNNDCIKVQGPFSSVESLTVVGVGVAGSNRGIVVGSDTMDIQRVSIVDVEVRATSREALYFEGSTDRGQITFLNTVERCHLRLNVAAGSSSNAMVYAGSQVVGLNFVETGLSEFTGHAFAADGGLNGDSMKFYRCYFDQPMDNTSAWLLFSGCHSAQLISCRFENTTTNNAPYKVQTQNGCTGFVARDCMLVTSTGGSNSAFFAIGQGGAAYTDTGTSIVNCWVDGISAPFDTTAHIIFGGGGETVSKHVLAGGGLRDRNTTPASDHTVYEWDGGSAHYYGGTAPTYRAVS